MAPENFPAEGVEVLLPYPQGTDRSCTFVITHMITSGERAGQIETLKGIKTKDGILVRFTSMSPVCITYQTHTSTGADRTAADTAVGVSPPRRQTAAAWRCGVRPACAAPPCSSL